MSRVYRALQKAEREKEEALQRKSSFEKAKEVETSKKVGAPFESPVGKGKGASLDVGDEVPLLVSSENPIATEEFRKLRTQVFHWSSPPPHVVLITSALAGEGKTVVSVNLAVAISQEIHKEAVLIDADLRKPSIRFEETSNSKGLSSYLMGQCPLSDTLIHPEAEKLWVIPAGPPSKKAAELIGSKRMEELLKSLRTFGEDTFIVIDAPPLLSTSEPLLLSKWVDGIVLVVMADRTSRESVKRAIQPIDKQKIIGVVLNQKEVQGSAYYSNYYQSYYQR